MRFTSKIKSTQYPKTSNTYDFDSILKEVNEYLKNHELDYAFQVLGQLKEIIDNEEYPSKVEMYLYEYTLAKAYIQNQSIKKARRILVKLTKNDHLFVPGYRLLADTYLNRNQVEAAEFVIKRGLEKNRNDSALNTSMANIMIRKGFYQSAYNWVAKALKDNPNNNNFFMLNSY